jgi:hypothetical protein
LACDLLVRLSSRRRFYRRPPPYAGRGAPRQHGPVFRTHDPATHGAPDRTRTVADPARGWVRVDAWERLHGQGAETVEVTVARVTVGRLPRYRSRCQTLTVVRGQDHPSVLLGLHRRFDVAPGRFVGGGGDAAGEATPPPPRRPSTASPPSPRTAPTTPASSGKPGLAPRSRATATPTGTV